VNETRFLDLLNLNAEELEALHPLIVIAYPNLNVEIVEAGTDRTVLSGVGDQSNVPSLHEGHLIGRAEQIGD
jgi:hypothetical protein